MDSASVRVTRLIISLLLLFVSAVLFAQPGTKPPANPLEKDVTQGALRVKTEAGGVVECPLKHTDVTASISGFIARVKVTQTFYNPYNEKIEAVYVFPLPHTAAVDDMTMVIGDRRIVGVIKRRAEARAIYEQALSQGLTASLLEQERPNIFTQSVGNIKPKQEIKIEISYVDVLKYDMGTYEFSFPMVVGPRYIPGAPISKTPPVAPELNGKVGEAPGPATGNDAKGAGWAPDTDRVPDASRITPPVLKPGYRTGHDISLSVTLDAGVPIQDIKVINHKADVKEYSDTKADAILDAGDAIPNKDFVMRYNVVGKKPEMAVLAHSKGSGEGYFMLMIQPKLDEELAKAPPRELVFLVDVSGSMSGAPTEKVKQAMREFFKLSKPDDTIQVIMFYSDSKKLFDKPVPATAENTEKALNFSQAYQAGGGTEMLKGIKMALDEPADPKRVRIVVMLTDGFIGNEAEIIQEVGKRAGDQVRFWTLGIGSSPNRFLLDGVAKQGGGASAVIELNTDPAKIVADVVERIHRAQLAHIQIDWKHLSVYETFPRRIPELWAGRPVILFGRYNDGGRATIELKGTVEGKPISYPLEVWLPFDKQPQHEVLAKVWARNKIEDLMSQDYYSDSPSVVEEVTQVALQYRLMSQYTSFVAVDESEARNLDETAKPPRRVPVAVPLPEGVEYEGIFGNATLGEKEGMDYFGRVSATPPSPVMPAPIVTADTTRAYFAGKPMEAAKLNLSITGGVRFEAKREQLQFGNYQGYLRNDAGGARYRQLAPASKAFAYSGKAPAGNRPLSGMLVFADAAADADERQIGRSQGQPFLQGFAARRHEEAKAALKIAGELEKKGELEEAFRRCQQAYLLETAFLTANPWNDDGTMAAAGEKLQDLSEAITAARIKAHPELKKKLDLLIRDESLSDTLRMVGKATGVKITVVKGSLEDAAALAGVLVLRVNYLDLRHATVAQALDWLLGAENLAWQIDKDGDITVASARRLAGNSAWVYDIAGLAIPTREELGDKDQQAKVEKALQDFLAGARLVLAQKDDSGLAPNTAVLIDTGRLLVYGNSEAHARIAVLLETLQDAKTSIGKLAPGNALDALQKTTAARWQARDKTRQDQATAIDKGRLLTALDTFTWPLLANAYQREVDLEALTELQIAWASPRMAEILESDNRWLALRSVWAISQAARLLEKDKELRALADRALATAGKQSEAVLAALQKKPEDGNAYYSALYAVLASRNAGALKLGGMAKATEIEALLLKEGKPEMAVARALAAGLLAPDEKADGVLRKAIDEGQIGGDDMMVLAALAVHARGGVLEQRFREQQPDLLGGQPLSGDVVVLVNRLGAEKAFAAHVPAPAPPVAGLPPALAIALSATLALGTGCLGLAQVKRRTHPGRA